MSNDRNHERFIVNIEGDCQVLQRYALNLNPEKFLLADMKQGKYQQIWKQNKHIWNKADMKQNTL